MKLFLGIIFLILPFLLVNRFKDKRKGFLYVLSGVIAFHFLTAAITQLLGVFDYFWVLGANILVGVFSLIFSPWPRMIKKIDYIFLIVLAIAFICLFSVHYDYTGKISTAVDFGFEEVENMEYPYPYFSDEWYAVSFIDYSLESGELPIVHTLIKGAPLFPNPEAPFHIFLSSIFLLLNLDPLTQYSFVAIFINLLIISLVYFFLRLNKINRLSSAVFSLFVLYITSGANFPGIWNLIPINIGILVSLIGFCFIALKDKKMAVFSSFLVFLFYPPLIPFYLLGLLVFLICFHKKNSLRTFILGTAGLVLVFVILTSFIWKVSPNFLEVSDYLWSKIYYPSFTFGAIPNFSIYHIIPIPVLILSFFSIFHLFKEKKWLLIQIAVALIFWFFYSFSMYRIIIEYERVVFYVALLITIASGFGLQEIVNYIKKETEGKYSLALKYIQIGIIFLFFFFSFFYTQIESWKELSITIDDTREKYLPTAPANKFLTEEDLDIFKDIKKKNFLSIPWKGTVIGVATDNYPLATKSGTISRDFKRYQEFMKADCFQKRKLAENWALDYVYLMEFNCKDFKSVSKSQEGLILYKFLNG